MRTYAHTPIRIIAPAHRRVNVLPPSTYVCACPGSSTHRRRFPVTQFAALLGALQTANPENDGQTGDRRIPHAYCTEDATEDMAQYYLEMCNGNCNDALQLYYEINGGPPTQGGQPKETTTDGDATQVGSHQKQSRVEESCSTQGDDSVREPDKHFNQALIHDMDDANFLHINAKNKNEKKKEMELGDTFGKLFSAPTSLICSLSLEEARKKAKAENKYILASIQDSEFDSLKLNRDIWNNEMVQDIIKDFFIFWLRHEHDQDALLFTSTYKVTKLPHICALCKRTGRKIKVWNIKNFQDPICAQSQLYEFIEMMVSRSEAGPLAGAAAGGGAAGGAESKGAHPFELPNEVAPTGANHNNMCSAVQANGSFNPLKGTPPPGAGEAQAVDSKRKGSGSPEGSLKATDEPTAEGGKNTVEYNQINNELSELHKLRLQRFRKG
ncbi:hypothetical protein PVIIG_03739 [Plasmodium vivax India VII]|uniref:UAS domain-containing protein n=4 Tax=Plasmodium vivax TaxID=5855 RepID=A5K4Q2_PLAVS|nr:hypothetical protein, conserved [Plasmodium vivax]EDL45630.1 hypothetical protein, conserved [Plasmodium vivax]KMZ80487.1 hypothetical protein PVIIG_03739 [Plasmodium vivax India VII]KMZ93044.1 hypothetical protein PVMG_04194 [Plasmodium vivax Mauritania I]SCO67341.1 conserved Plasmodium protein, unknown function [Plasmodium vivax]|eukprot:XP_001615357.1 hypothetical protein [Plasmodium vivax Sal-1]